MIDSVSIETIEDMLKHRNTSYKLFLMKYLTENISKDKTRFSFMELSCGIVAMAWSYYETNYERFTKTDRIYDLVQYVLSLNGDITIYSSYDDVFKFLLESTDKKITYRLRQLSMYVPYRLLLPFIKDYKLNSLTWDKQNEKIEELSQQYEMFYTIYGNEITINDKWVKYICNNRILVCQRVDFLLKKAYEKKKSYLC